MRADDVRQIALFLLVSLTVTGCGGCGSDGPTPGDNSGARCPEVPCRDVEQCVEGVCIGLTDLVCFPPCGDNEICQLGECIEGVEVCQQAGQSCDVTMPISGDFYCIDWDGFTTGEPAVCAPPCAPGSVCGEGEACFVLSGLEEGTACAADTDCEVGRLCQGGTCEAAACQASECQGYLDGLAACEQKYGASPDFASGVTCQELPDGTSFCFEAGNAREGERCESFIDGLIADNLTGTCGEGLACIEGLCRVACQETVPCASESDACLFAGEDYVATGVGFCGRSCTPFSLGECGEESKCLPIDAERGYCVPAGDARPFESCTPGEWACEEGTTCVDVGAGDGRCYPLCNVTVSPMDPSAQVGPRDQILRDETCPQPIDVAQGYVRLVNAFPAGGDAFDVYLDRGERPWIEGLGPGDVAAQEGSAFLILPPGTHLLEVWPAGVDPLEAPLADVTVSVTRDRVKEVALATPPPDMAERLTISTREVAGNDEAIRAIWHLVPDVSRVEVREGEGEEVSLGEVFYGEVLNLPEDTIAPSAEWVVRDALTGDALLTSFIDMDSTQERVLYLSGTRDPDDAFPIALQSSGIAQRPEALPPPPRMLCNDLGSDVFGFCQESCQDASDYGQQDEEVCRGDEMGCYPLRLPGLLGYRSVCGPQGEGGEGDRCDPFGAVNACASGLYCLEYGSGDPQVANGSPRGVCTRLCGIDDENEQSLSCREGDICQPIDAATIDVGQCGRPCTPDGAYQDERCPAGLKTCKPAAILIEDMQGAGDAAPVAIDVDEVCSASGAINEGESCPGVDCAPGLECLFPRSAQGDLVSTLLSPYFGVAGTSPTCRAYCDPFDEVRATRRCGMAETCLVNFPWSADVGHCAPIAEQVEPFQACTRPGESCGEDSVCVIDGGAPFCLRLCEYAGGSSAMDFAQSTCPGGLQCAPLVNDVGFCQ